MTDELHSCTPQTNQLSDDFRAQVAIDRLFTQQRLRGFEGIQVRLSNQNQVYLNTKRPTRVGISARLLEKMVPGFVAGEKAFLKANYGKATAYHLYNGGLDWIPTVPETVGKPDDVFDMKVELLMIASFLDSFPRIWMGTKRPQAWMTDWSEIGVSRSADELELEVEQHPPVEGIAHFALKVRLVEDLVFQTGSIFTVVELEDVFSVPRFLQLHHNGNTRAWIALNRRRSSRIKLLSFDGFRLRMRYSGGRMHFGTVVYLKDPSQLYTLGRFKSVPEESAVGWAERIFRVSDTRPVRDLERMMVRHADFYETGRIGAEIAYSILKDKLRIHGLVLNEPGRGGPDLQTKDKHTIAESRFLIQVEPSQLKAQIQRDLAQMTRKVRREFRHGADSKLGYAVISFLNGSRIDSLVVEMASPTS
jgi:hypothetical protein